jgi:hypothetical protein
MSPTHRLSPKLWLGAILVVGCLVQIPSVRCPYILDDYMHVAMISGRLGISHGPLDVYDFVNDADRKVFIERGLLPWWSHPELKIRFFRPLSSALRWIEEKVTGGQLLVMHLHSLAWWLAAVLAARLLFRRTLPERPALIATAIFALGPWHVLPIAWLANREALVSLTFGLLGLDALERWHDDEKPRFALLAALMFVVSLAGGEYAICFGGYVVGMAIARRDRRLDRRATGLLAFLIPAIAYLAIRAKLGYGAYASAFYSDPLKEPLEYLERAPWRVVTLLCEGWLTLGTSAWGTNAARWNQALLAGGLVVVAVVLLRRVVAAVGARERRAIAWMLLGSLGALVPVLAVVPAPRLLGIAAIGIAAIVALLVDHAWFPPSGETPRFVWASATLLAFLHLVHGPAASWIAAHNLREVSLRYEKSARALGARLKDYGQAEAVVVRGGAGMFFGPFALTDDGAPPGRWRILAHTGHVLALRIDERTLELKVPNGQGIYPIGPGSLYRRENIPLVAGDVIEVPGMKVRIVEAGTAGPSVVRFTFDTPLEEAPRFFLQEEALGFADVSPPAPGFGIPLDP